MDLLKENPPENVMLAATSLETFDRAFYEKPLWTLVIYSFKAILNKKLYTLERNKPVRTLLT